MWGEIFIAVKLQNVWWPEINSKLVAWRIQGVSRSILLQYSTWLLCSLSSEHTICPVYTAHTLKMPRNKTWNTLLKFRCMVCQNQPQTDYIYKHFCPYRSNCTKTKDFNWLSCCHSLAYRQSSGLHCVGMLSFFKITAWVAILVMFLLLR